MFASGGLLPLVPGFTDSAQALYIEQTIERHLGVVNRPVGDELARG